MGSFGKKTLNPGYQPGNYWVECQRCGFAIRQSSSRKEWTGKIVCPECYDTRHPQDLLPSFEDNTTPKGLVSSESTDTFATVIYDDDIINLSDITYSSNSITIASTESSGIYISPNGNKLYRANSDGVDHVVEEYNVTSGDITTVATTGNTLDTSAQTGAGLVSDVTLTGNLNRLYVCDQLLSAVFQYNLTSGDVTTGSYSGNSLSTGTTPTGLFIKPGGDKLYVFRFNDDLEEYTMTTSGELDTATLTTKVNLSDILPSGITQLSAPMGVVITTNGKGLYVVDHTRIAIYSYVFSTPWNLTNGLRYVNRFSLSGQMSSIQLTGVGIYNDSNLYVNCQQVGDTVIYQYN